MLDPVRLNDLRYACAMHDTKVLTRNRKGKQYLMLVPLSSTKNVWDVTPLVAKYFPGSYVTSGGPNGATFRVP